MNLNAKALVYSAIGAVWLVVAMTLGAELSAPFKALLAKLTEHHWISKSLIATLVFVIFYFMLKKSDDSRGMLGSVLFLIVSIVLGGLAIFGFYLWHFLQG